MSEPASPAVNYGKVLSGASEALFPDAGYNGFQERWVHNSGANSIALNLFGGVAALNSKDCINIPANGSWAGRVSNAITVIGTAAQPVAAGQR